jgi:CO/xanthine dehydrogenase FAD-binding subunit
MYDVPVLTPRSPEETAEAFGDGSEITVLGGGTILLPEVTYARTKPKRVLMLAHSGLDRIERSNGTVTIGAAVRVAQLLDGDEPLATAARYVGDPEVRAQATVGGNLCAPPGETPRGDLQAPLIALGARVRSTGAGGERTEALEDFLTGAGARLVLDVSYDDAERKTGYAAFWRPHTHHYTILAVAAARTNGQLRLAATGVAPHAVLLNPGDPLAGLEPPDDALASAWYRKQILPRLVEQALEGVR